MSRLLNLDIGMVKYHLDNLGDLNFAQLSASDK
jgi:hypothetical protein